MKSESADVPRIGPTRGRSLPLLPPSFCQYADGACDHTFSAPVKPRVFFAYAGDPVPIADAISKAAKLLEGRSPEREYLTWQNMDSRGQVIFCEICKSVRSSDVLVADITTLNFNLMFEIGYGLGLGMPVVTVKDTTVTTHAHQFEDIGVLDTLGYVRFRNATELADGLRDLDNVAPLPPFPISDARKQPIFLMKSPEPVEGSLAVHAALKKSGLGFRSFDPLETRRLSLNDARRHVDQSIGVVADLLDPSRKGAVEHNARCAFVCGMAMSQGKSVLMLQEEMSQVRQPLDYRDVVRPYHSASNVPGLMRDFLKSVVEGLQDDERESVDGLANPLTHIDLGDVAAENEVTGLQHYFVSTGQSTQARQGHARLVVGRKGAGKTAIFYDVRRAVRRGHQRLVVDLKPEGHQFVQMKESLLDRLGVGLQEHTMVAFWHYILLSEIARQALAHDRAIANRDPLTFERWESLRDIYGSHDPGADLDFSQRLIAQVDRVTRRLGTSKPQEVGNRLTEVIYSGDYRELSDAVQQYLRLKDGVWLLIDNLDKGWPIRNASDTDILIVRSLLEATRKLQRELGDQRLDFHCLVFLRSDIHELLRESTPDKGKDTAIRLDWEDPKVFEQMLGLRLTQSGEEEAFGDVWSRMCTPLVNGQASFDYIVERTLMRPRDVLKFVRHCIDVALNRGHTQVTEDDVLQAEKLYSADMLSETAYEIADTHPELADALYAFEDSPACMTEDEVSDRLTTLLGLNQEAAREALQLLIWFGFLGVTGSADQPPRFGYQVQGNLRRLTWMLDTGESLLWIHPAFCSALRTGEPTATATQLPPAQQVLGTN